jgi:hypothetical protein
VKLDPLCEIDVPEPSGKPHPYGRREHEGIDARDVAS